jgi:putative endonuclease
MHYVYILYSQKLNKYYVGETGDLQNRLIQHNTGFYKASYTTKANDWVVKTAIPFHSVSSAKKAENFIKKMNSRKFTEALILENNWLIQKFND